jgi:hypothetical protein
MDNGLVTGKVKTYCTNEGLLIHPIASHRHQQNGPFNHSILEYQETKIDILNSIATSMPDLIGVIAERKFKSALSASSNIRRRRI